MTITSTHAIFALFGFFLGAGVMHMTLSAKVAAIRSEVSHDRDY